MLSLKSEYISICDTLNRQGFSHPGNIFNPSAEETGCLIKVLKELIEDRKRASDYKTKMNDNMS